MATPQAQAHAQAAFAELLQARERKQLVRLVVIGSVDDGKSTLIGRLLYETGSLPEDQIEQVRRSSKNGDAIDFSLFTDGLRAEREQGITIEVAYRYFETASRKFILADTPGHAQYTRNMATGASTADAAVILVDARLGVLPQTRRHAAIASLLGIPRLAVAINKMDLVGFDEAAFRRIEQEVRAFAQPLGFAQLSFFPVSARLGDNITTSSARAPWHTGGTVLQFLDTVPVDRERAGHPFRFPVQTVIRTKEQDSRGLAGQIAAGSVAVGDEVVVLPSGARSRVKAIETFEGPLARAQAPQSVLLRLAHEVDASRGDLLAPPEDAPVPRLRFEATAIWLSEQPLDLGRAYLVKHTTRSTPARIEAVLSLLDPETLKEAPATTLALNDIGRISIRCGRPMVVEPYAKSRATGALILIDAISNETVAAATVCAENAGAGPGGDPAGKREQGQRRTAVAAPILVVVGEEEEATLAAAHKLEKKLSERGHLVTVARRVGPALACSDAGVIVLLPMVGEDRARVLLNTALSAGARAARIDAAEQGGFEVGFEEALAALGR